MGGVKGCNLTVLIMCDKVWEAAGGHGSGHRIDWSIWSSFKV